jgi:hypothetical protein
MKRKTIQFMIDKKKWVVRFGNPGSTDGKPDDAVCDYDARAIILRRKSVGSLLNCIAHEVIHARCPDLDETAVHDCGDLIDEVFNKVLATLVHKP